MTRQSRSAPLQRGGEARLVVKWRAPRECETKPQIKDFGGDFGAGQPPYPGEAEVRYWDPDRLWVVMAARSFFRYKPKGSPNVWL